MLQWFQDLVALVERLIWPHTPDDGCEERVSSVM